MSGIRIAATAAAALLALLGIAVALRLFAAAGQPVAPRAPVGAGPRAEAAAPEPEAAAGASAGFLYGRVTTRTGAASEGRLRWGGGEEAFWGDYFNGAKVGNPWAELVPAARRPRQRSRFELFGLRLFERERPADLGRLFMARFGDLARIEASRTEVRVTTKSGRLVVLDRFEASDFDDGVRVWDAAGGVIDLDSRAIRAIELLPRAWTGAAPARLHGTVRTAAGEFTGFLQWNREAGAGSDELHGRGADGEVALRFDAIRAIARQGRDAARVTLADGREVELSGRVLGERFRGVYVDDPRYGRVLVSRAAFERVDFDDLGLRDSGPAYGDFPPGRPLAGRVTTRDGRTLAGRLVYDLDESETTETLDAPADGIDYTIPFGLVAAIALPAAGAAQGSPARVTLASGEELELEPAGDLGGRNAGLLVFVAGEDRPEYLPWSAVERIDLAP